MSHLTVRLFGGVDVRLDDRQVTVFESQKVRALLAFLLVQRNRSFSRQYLATLFWPDKSDKAARRNLRQAVYNLKSTLGHKAASGPIRSSGSELRIDPELDCWVDVEAFEQARRQGISKGAVDPHYLTAAVALYRGDFLSGFTLKDNLEFQYWQLAEQERLRDLAVDALRALIESYLSRGELRLGLRHARRLVSIDPLSEEAHRYLMRLYALSDQRSRALAQYDELRDTLSHELGIEPVEESQRLYAKILQEQTPAPKEEVAKGIAPLIPMVGRQEPYRRLGECWQEVLQGRCRLTIVEGEPGAGKNRLVKSFLDAASSRRTVAILKGRCDDLVPTSYQPFTQVLRGAIAEDSRRASAVVETITAEEQASLALLMPELCDLQLGLQPAVNLGNRRDRDRLFECVARVFEELCRPAEIGTATEPLVLMLGDLQWAAQESVELLDYLLARLAKTPVWILATSQTGGGRGEPPPFQRLLAGDSHARVAHIALDRLGSEAIHELAATLVGNDQAGELARFLILHTHGLPLAIAEWVNSMWDLDILDQQSGHWRLTDSLDRLSGDLDELIRNRLHRLPNSTRRLASQAAVMGQQFDAELLCKAANEHMGVVEIGLELLLERWLVRQHSDYWMTGRREHDIVLWARGARRGRFEFNHHLIWRAILEDVNPLRQQIMHRETAEALEQELGGRQTERFCEVLAFHFAHADVWDQAIIHLRRASDRARALLAVDTARHYLCQACKALQRLAGAARTTGEEQRWLREREETIAALEDVEQRL